MVKENHLPLPLCSVISYHAILLFYLSSTDELNCTFSTDISVQNLSRDWHILLGPKDSIIAVCVHGGELRLSRLWASVKVMLKFEKTEVQFYEAERWSDFVNIIWLNVTCLYTWPILLCFGMTIYDKSTWSTEKSDSETKPKLNHSMQKNYKGGKYLKKLFFNTGRGGITQ